MNKLPEKLTRKAIIQHFTRLSEARWGHLFEHEKENGIHDLRVEGHFKKAYYDTDRIMAWLVTEGVYTVSDFCTSATSANAWGGLAVRTHVMG